MLVRLYALNQKVEKHYDASGKAMKDVLNIFRQCGVKIIPGVSKDAKKIFKVLDIPILTLYTLFAIPKKSGVIFSFPDNKIKIRLLGKLKKIKKITVICFVNDINSIRYEDITRPDVIAGIKEEMELMGIADVILAPNKNTIEFLKGQGLHARMIPVGVWDYVLNDRQTESIHNEEKMPKGRFKVAFAGNLNKSPFIFDLDKVTTDKVSYELWGNLDKKDRLYPDAVYHGAMHPEELISDVCHCHFGLVWDGTGINSCESGLGVYLRYNNSHKCGMYLAAGLPVFVWSESGMSHFVKENHCGFVISSLKEIPQVLEKLTEEEYEELRENVAVVSDKIRRGEYLKETLAQI